MSLFLLLVCYIWQVLEELGNINDLPSPCHGIGLLALSNELKFLLLCLLFSAGAGGAG
jgi:hypothetical protein